MFTKVQSYFFIFPHKWGLQYNPYCYLGGSVSEGIFSPICPEDSKPKTNLSLALIFVGSFFELEVVIEST